MRIKLCVHSLLLLLLLILRILLVLLLLLIQLTRSDVEGQVGVT